MATAATTNTAAATATIPRRRGRRTVARLVPSGLMAGPYREGAGEVGIETPGGASGTPWYVADPISVTLPIGQ